MIVFKDIAKLVALLASVLAMALVITYFENENGYKQGQIDAINGIIKYELKHNKDNTTKWVKRSAPNR